MFEKLKKLLTGGSIVKSGTERPTNITGSSNIDSLISLAVKSKAGLEQLQEVMKMKYEHEAREAKKKFHYEFCRLQAALPEIPKNKQVKNDRKELLYSYSSLSMTVKTIKPSMKEYGFSYSWSEEIVKDGVKRVHNHITGYGHTESTYVDIPIMDSGRMTNEIQQTGSATTYGKRYSLCNSLGIISDEDDDGRSAGKKKSESSPPKNITPEPVEELKYKGLTRGDYITAIWGLCKENGCKKAGEARSTVGVPFDTDPTIPLERLHELKIELEVKIKADKDLEKEQKDMEEKSAQEESPIN